MAFQENGWKDLKETWFDTFGHFKDLLGEKKQDLWSKFDIPQVIVMVSKPLVFYPCMWDFWGGGGVLHACDPTEAVWKGWALNENRPWKEKKEN